MSRPGESDYYRGFTEALLSPSADAVPGNLDGQALKRFRIYRNNVHAALIDALKAAYPVVNRLVGDDFFAAIAREFLLSERVRSRSLALYGDGFGGFIARFPPAKSLPYLADVARLERARLEAVNAADEPVLQTTDLPVDGEVMVDLCLAAHAATRLQTSIHPIFSIWHANQQGSESTAILSGHESVLVTRPGDSLQMFVLEQDAMIFLLDKGS